MRAPPAAPATFSTPDQFVEFEIEGLNEFFTKQHHSESLLWLSSNHFYFSGVLKIAEVKSRFVDVDEFISGVSSLGFSLVDQVGKIMWNQFNINFFNNWSFRHV